MDLFLIYLICFGVGLLFTILSAVFADLGGGQDAHVETHAEMQGGHAEAGFGDHDMPGFSAISPTSIASFVTAFGGFGMIFSKIDATATPWISVPLAALCGLGVAFGVVWLFRAVFRATQASSEARVGRIVGVSGTIITPIPANGVGEIAYVQAGSRYTAPAREETGQPVTVGQTVKITRVVGTQFYVTVLPS